MVRWSDIWILFVRQSTTILDFRVRYFFEVLDLLVCWLETSRRNSFMLEIPFVLQYFTSLLSLFMTLTYSHTHTQTLEYLHTFLTQYNGVAEFKTYLIRKFEGHNNRDSFYCRSSNLGGGDLVHILFFYAVSFCGVPLNCWFFVFCCISWFFLWFLYYGFTSSCFVVSDPDIPFLMLVFFSWNNGIVSSDFEPPIGGWWFDFWPLVSVSWFRFLASVSFYLNLISSVWSWSLCSEPCFLVRSWSR